MKRKPYFLVQFAGDDVVYKVTGVKTSRQARAKINSLSGETLGVWRKHGVGFFGTTIFKAKRTWTRRG